jgi:NAD(P)-dependent dehydrogenase (short-subunit alcohol dehydrogenase family)
MRLAEKIALVIGAGSGIGRAVALRFANEGALVAVADLIPEAGQETASLITAAGGTAFYWRVDVTQREQIRCMLAEVEARFGRLDILVNSAGIPGRGRIEEVADELWDRVVAVNLSGVFWACKYAIPLLKRAGGGVIINLGSVAGLHGWPGSAIYSATKGGVIMLSRSLAADYARENIRVWAICPTAVDTPLINNLLFAPEADPQAARQAYEAREPMGRMISSTEVADAALYLASAEKPPYTPEPFIV